MKLVINHIINRSGLRPCGDQPAVPVCHHRERFRHRAVQRHRQRPVSLTGGASIDVERRRTHTAALPPQGGDRNARYRSPPFFNETIINA